MSTWPYFSPFSGISSFRLSALHELNTDGCNSKSQNHKPTRMYISPLASDTRLDKPNLVLSLLSLLMSIPWIGHCSERTRYVLLAIIAARASPLLYLDLHATHQFQSYLSCFTACVCGRSATVRANLSSFISLSYALTDLLIPLRLPLNYVRHEFTSEQFCL
jgi:hypothetical protein